MIKKLIAFTFVLIMQSSLVAASSASSFDYQNILEDFSEGVSEQSQDLEEGAQAIELITFDEEVAAGGGTAIIVNTIQTFLDFFKLIVAPIAVIFIIVMGIRMIAAGSENEEALSNAKNYVTYAAEGLILIFMADAIVNVFFGAEGEVLRAGEAGAKEFGRQSSQLFEGIYSLIQVVIGSIAVFVLVTAGMRYIGGSFSDDQIASAKRQITWALVGLFVVGVSEFVVKEVLFPAQGQELGVGAGEQLIANVTNFIAGTIGTLSFAFLLYAGYLYVTARDNEDQVSKAKKIIVGAFIGIILAGAAFALSTTLVELDVSR